MAKKSKKTTREIGNELHDRMRILFSKMDFRILDSDYNAEGPDIVIQDDSLKVKILIQCKKHEGEEKTYSAISRLTDEYAHKVSRMKASAAILTLSGYKPSRRVNISEEIRTKKVSIWTDSLIDYYEDLTKKIGLYAKYQMLSDLGLKVRFDKDKEFDAIKVSQNGIEFYAFKASPEWLLRSAAVVRRINLGGRLTGYQRLLSRDRVKNKIPKFLDEGEWVFPNTIIFASELGLDIRYKDGKMIFPSKLGSVWVIDGQHRLYSFANIQNSVVRESSELLCTVIDSSALGQDAEAKQASIFVTLNQQAKKVDKSLIFELYRLLGLTDPGVEIAIRLSESKLFKGLVSGYSDKGGLITITTLVASIKSLISASNPLLRVRLNDRNVADILFNKLYIFFQKVNKVFRKEWGSEKYILSENRGVGALIELYNKALIFCKNNNKDLDNYSIKLLESLKKSGFNLSSENLKGQYLGEGGPRKLAMEWASLITKTIPGFEPGVEERTIDKFSSKHGDLQGAENKLKDWLPNLKGEIRGKLMHIDPTTIEYLRCIPKETNMRIFFGDADEEALVRERLRKMRADGYKIILTKAQKPTKGSLFHERWIASEALRIQLNCDLKKQAIKNATYFMYLSEWNKAPEIVEFDQDWQQAQREFQFEYNWGA